MTVAQLIKRLSYSNDDAIVCIHSAHTYENLILTTNDIKDALGIVDGEEIVEVYDNNAKDVIEFVKLRTYH